MKKYKFLSDNAFVLVSKIYSAGIGIILLPYFIALLGKEQYGLIGSFVVIQACMQILDAGVSGVLTRQSIVTQNNHESFEKFLGALKYLFLVFFIVSIIIVIAGWYFANVYSVDWFKSTLDAHIIITCVFYMFVIFAIRYIEGPLRSILISYQKHKVLSYINIFYVSLSGPVTLLYLHFFENNILDYFIIQLCMVTLSLLITSYFTWIETTKVRTYLKKFKSDSDFIKTSLLKLIKFGVQLSILSMLWVIVNQSDKLTLTKVMELSEYSFYSIAISILGIISIFVGTLSQTVRPKLISYLNQEKYTDFTELFKKSVLSLVSLLIPLVVYLIYWGSDLLFLWTDNVELSSKVMIYLPYLLIGTFFSALSEFSFMILYATGRLKSHTLFYTFISFILVPLNIVIATQFLGEGSAKLFMMVNILLFITWSMYNIKKHILNSGVLFGMNILFSLMISILTVYFSKDIVGTPGLIWLISLNICGLIAISLSFILSSKITSYFNIRFRMSSL